jgi:hypothetical protein
VNHTENPVPRVKNSADKGDGAGQGGPRRPVEGNSPLSRQLVRLRERAEQLFVEVAEEFEIDIIEMEVSPDHIHLMVSFGPKRGIGEVVRIFKSVVARELFREFPSLKKDYGAGNFGKAGSLPGRLETE